MHFKQNGVLDGYENIVLSKSLSELFFLTHFYHYLIYECQVVLSFIGLIKTIGAFNKWVLRLESFSDYLIQVLEPFELNLQGFTI